MTTTTEPTYFAAKPRPKPTTARTRLNALRRIRDAAIAAAEAHPDFVYGFGRSATCYYYPDSKSPVGCIIGHAARSVGYDLDAYGSCGVVTAFQCSINLPLHSCDRTKAENLIVSALGALQGNQDQGRPWSEALATADRCYPGWREA